MSDEEVWTIDQTAAHLDLNRRSVLRWIREGLPTYGQGRYLRRSEALAEYRRRLERQNATRAQRSA